MKSLILNSEKCLELAAVLKRVQINPDFLNRPFIRMPLENEIRVRMLLFSVAICHQTHSLRSEKTGLTGWEYMEQVFLDTALHRTELLNPKFIIKTNPNQLRDLLLKAFSDNNLANTSTLDRIDERIHLYRNTALVLEKQYKGSAIDLLKKTNGFLVRNGSGLYELMEDFEAFTDPLRKKTTFFLKLAGDSGVFHVNDTENIIPIMDYHMQRVLLRTGCVIISDGILKQKLIKRIPVGSDHEIRQTCNEALQLISQHSGHKVLLMNDIFWPVGRSCCNETCLCETGFCEKSPCTLTKTIKLEEHLKCIFESCCPGKSDVNVRSLWQPVLETHYY